MAGDTETSLLVYSLCVLRLALSGLTLFPLSSPCWASPASYWNLLWGTQPQRLNSCFWRQNCPSCRWHKQASKLFAAHLPYISQGPAERLTTVNAAT